MAEMVDNVDARSVLFSLTDETREMVDEVIVRDKRVDLLLSHT